MTEDTKAPTMPARERWARVIDPDEWLALDRERERLTTKGRIISISDAVKERRCKRSLAKADALLSDLPRPDEGWRAIPETVDTSKAPFHERAVLLAAGDRSGLQVVGEAEWRGDADSGAFWWANTYGDHNADPIFMNWTPSHWRLLPEPPHQEGGGE